MVVDIAKTRFLAFDFEMTGLSPGEDSIIEVGAIPLLGPNPDGDYFFTPVQPYTIVRSASKRVHGIDGNHLWDAPPAEIAMTQFFRLARGRVLLGQNPSVDLAFMWSAAKLVGGDPPADWALDLAKLFKVAFPDQRSLSLRSMARRVGITVEDDFHNALQDALLVAKVFAKIVPLLRVKGISTLDGLISAGRVVKGEG